MDCSDRLFWTEELPHFTTGKKVFPAFRKEVF